MRSLSTKQKEILKIAAIPVIYLLSLVMFVRLTFPYDTLKSRIVAQFNSSQNEKRLEIDEMSGSGLFGVEVEGVRLIELVTRPRAAEESQPPQSLAVESASVSVSVLSYLFGTLSVQFEAEVGGGQLEGSFRQDDAAAQIEADGAGIDISGLTLLSAAIGLPLSGELGGSVELVLPEGKMKKADGAFALEIQNLTAGDGKAKIRNTIALPKLKAGNLVFKAEATKGRLEISEFSANGPDFELDASGQMRLREPFDKSVLNVDATFRFKEAYTNKSDLTRGIFGSPDSKIPALFDMDPMVRKAKKPDGSYSWRVGGLMSQPSFRPGGAGRSRNRGNGPPPVP